MPMGGCSSDPCNERCTRDHGHHDQHLQVPTGVQQQTLKQSLVIIESKSRRNEDHCIDKEESR